MDAHQINQLLLHTIRTWDPFGYGYDAYETEAVDVLQAVHDCDEPKMLAEKIQAIYEFSFEKVIPFHECVKMAKKLLEIKESAACSLP
ncbi:DUF1871 family protein [Parageobacillus toebii]|uniref:DUF1871 family protein n=1 Tax=Parageobacillus toebii TaxID=153151 RepID=UPI0035B536FE